MKYSNMHEKPGPEFKALWEEAKASADNLGITVDRLLKVVLGDEVFAKVMARQMALTEEHISDLAEMKRKVGEFVGREATLSDKEWLAEYRKLNKECQRRLQTSMDDIARTYYVPAAVIIVWSNRETNIINSIHRGFTSQYDGFRVFCLNDLSYSEIGEVIVPTIREMGNIGRKCLYLARYGEHVIMTGKVITDQQAEEILGYFE